MKKYLWVSGLVFMSASLAFAATETPNHPCAPILSACQAAGFYKGGHQPKKNVLKGLWKDCFNPILAGQAVTGVTVNPSDVQACQAKRASKKNS